jgi:hypothetical protein
MAVPAATNQANATVITDLLIMPPRQKFCLCSPWIAQEKPVYNMGLG